jgi:hypothetical protein
MIMALWRHYHPQEYEERVSLLHLPPAAPPSSPVNIEDMSDSSSHSDATADTESISNSDSDNDDIEE